MSNEACQFGKEHGTCEFGLMSFLFGTKDELRTEQMKAFRDAYCTPCLEAKKISALNDIKKELSWIREEMAVSNDR